MVNLKKLLKEKEVTIKTCSDIYGIPYASLHALVNGKADIRNCTYETARKLARFVGIPMEYLDIPDTPFLVFRSNLHHTLKNTGEMQVRLDIISFSLVDAYMLNGLETEGLYMLSLLEYIENRYNLAHDPVVGRYEGYKLKNPFYFGDPERQDPSRYLTEFRKRNIMEGDLYDAI